MKMKILSCVLINCLFMLSNTFGSCVYIIPNCASINRDALLSCMDKNTWNFGSSSLRSYYEPFIIPRKCNTFIGISEYIESVNSFLLSNELPVWYCNLLLCRTFFIIGKNYWSLFDEVSYERLPDKCKELLNGNIEELRKKCDRKSAQKLSVLTAINTPWEDALSAMKKIVKESAFTHDFSLTEALFILHLKPSQHCNNNNNNNSIWNSFSKLFPKNNEYKEEDVLFYAEYITGALACVLKYEKKIPSNFEFDIIQTNDLSWCFLKNVKKLIQAYTNYFTNGKNKINNNKNKKEVYNTSQEEEKCKLKQD